MEKTLEYLASKYVDLSDDYKIPDGKGYSESCSMIAFEVAKKLILDGEKWPVIAIFGKQTINGPWVGFEDLKPLRYKERVTWAVHIVCVYNNKVYDPMVSEFPVPVKEYPMKAFGKEIPFEIRFDEVDILKKLKRF